MKKATVSHFILAMTAFMMAISVGVLTVGAVEGTPLTGGWRFQKGDIVEAAAPNFNDATWERVTIPHTWNMDVLQVGPKTYLGPSWYRTTIDVPAANDGQRRFLRFEGASTIADVYLNGQHLGQHRGGYSAFCFEITRLLQPGSNTLAVRVDNAFDPTVAPMNANLFTRWGGIYRPVRLLVKNSTCITPLDYASPGIYLLQKAISQAKVELRLTAKLSNGLSRDVPREIVFLVKNAEGATVKQVTQKVTLPASATTTVSLDCVLEHPHLWNGRKDPYLYTVTAELRDAAAVVDRVVQPLGLRFYRVDPQQGFFLNGEHFALHGVCRHQEWEQYGAAMTDEQHRIDVALIYEIGATALRLAHYQQAETMYRLCDQNGIIVWAEIPCANDWKEGPFEKNCEQQLTELIRQNFNHPSILFWGMYNESNITKAGVEQLHQLAKREDPSRLTTAASDMALAAKHAVTDLICWNRYPYWYTGPASVCQWRENLLKKAPTLCAGLSEYGAGGCIDQHEMNLARPDPQKGKFFPEEYQAIVHEKIWSDIKDCSSLWASFAWNMFDFSWGRVNRGNRPYLNQKGLITYDRATKKDAFYFYKANWSEEPVLYITSRRFTQRTLPTTDVKVYANTGKVTLLVNDQPLGEKMPDEIRVARWTNVTLRPGRNTIEVRSVRDRKTLSDRCEWELKE
jgi:beta-galactosidase